MAHIKLWIFATNLVALSVPFGLCSGVLGLFSLFEISRGLILNSFSISGSPQEGRQLKEEAKPTMNFNFLIHEFWNAGNSKVNDLIIVSITGHQFNRDPNNFVLIVDYLLAHRTIWIRKSNVWFIRWDLDDPPWQDPSVRDAQMTCKIELSATSILVTDVGDEIRWWQFLRCWWRFLAIPVTKI